jgi:NAD(P)H-hydrate epimerase
MGCKCPAQGSSQRAGDDRRRDVHQPHGKPFPRERGSGDILTGFIGGLASQGYNLTQSALFGAYLHGYMADTWVENHSDMDLLALDLVTGLGDAIEEIRNGTDRVYIERSL